MTTVVIEIYRCRECKFFGNGLCTHPQRRTEKMGKVKLSDIEVDGDAPPPESCPLESAEDFAESNFNPDRQD